MLKKYIKTFLVLFLLFSLGMILSYLIPNQALEPQYSKSIAQLDKEDPYPSPLFSTDAAILDNFMDKLMIQTCKISDAYESSIKAAFDNNGYPRYWNGYLLTLRPVLSQFTYQQIRYLNTFLLLISFCLCFSKIHQQLGFIHAVGFSISIIACFLVLIGESFQYFTVFFILFIEILFMLYDRILWNGKYFPLFLFAAGMFTNFFDMLTAPLLTLGIPLALYISLILRNQPDKSINLLRLMLELIKNCISWGLGYALCWVSKWAIGSVVLNINVFNDALKTAKFRVEGSENYPLDRGLMFRLNVDTYYFAKGHKPAVFLCAILAIFTIFVIKYHHADWIKRVVPSICVGALSYIWYFVFANHSQLHYFFTYRIQAIALFSVFAAIGNALDTEKARNRIEKSMSLIHTLHF